MIMPSTGFSHGVVLFLTHVSQNICSYLSCVSEVPRSSFLFERHLSEMMPPYGFNAPKNVLTHTCVITFLACFCVSEILTHRNRPHKKFATFCGGTAPLSLFSFSVSLHLRVAGAVATFLRTHRTSLLLWCLFPCPSRQPSCNSLPLSRTHLSPLLQADVEILQADPTPWSWTAGYMWAITLGSSSRLFNSWAFVRALCTRRARRHWATGQKAEEISTGNIRISNQKSYGVGYSASRGQKWEKVQSLQDMWHHHTSKSDCAMAKPCQNLQRIEGNHSPPVGSSTEARCAVYCWRGEAPSQALRRIYCGVLAV